MRTLLVGILAAGLISPQIVIIAKKKAGGGTPPSITDFQASTFTNSETTETTPSLTWSAGNTIVCLGVTRSNSYTLSTPTATGLTFSLIVETPGTGSNARNYAWSAVAGSGGSGAVSAGTDGVSTNRGLACFVVANTSGVGDTTILDNSTAKVISSERTQTDSAVLVSMGDWNAIADTTVTPSPGDGTQRVAVQNGNYAVFIFSWVSQGAAATTNYGITDHTGTVKMSGLAVEMIP